MVKALVIKPLMNLVNYKQSFFHQFSVFIELHMASHLPVSVSTASKASWFTANYTYGKTYGLLSMAVYFSSSLQYSHYAIYNESTITSKTFVIF